MAKDVIGNELYETDIVSLDLEATRCIGVIKEVHSGRARKVKGKTVGGGFVRIVAHFDIPVDDAGDLLSGVVKIANPDHHKRIYGKSQSEPVAGLRRLQESAYDHRLEEETINTLQR